MKNQEAFLGEFIGTYLLVLFGTGAVAVSTLFEQYDGILPVALVWGIAVTLGIYTTRNLCCAHFNPAVSIAMVASRRMSARKLPVYLSAQFTGALAAAFTIYGVFANNIATYESANHIIRGTQASRMSAKMFGEYYYFGGEQTVSMPLAMVAEGLGTFLLILMIFVLTEGCNTGKPGNDLSPMFIGLSLCMVICLFAPLTQAGFNPARDFSPRIVAFVFGWGEAAFPDAKGGFFFVYMFAPVVGGILAGMLFTKVIEPTMDRKLTDCSCCDREEVL
ncbi:aquaporin [Hornefia porci]|uniref:Aquaporin n=1 Tax=Hornefia porci TaxID=2652292 RepID=A0A1Q9JJ26_9FIRM|nr:aquaporin [Hornefia porci]OLR56141.1 aquaporin [Hornefia porci]